MRNFEPASKQFNERKITRVQGDIEGAPDFGAGAFSDIPASMIPANGVAELENYRAYGKYLLPRTGTKKWGDWNAGTSQARLPYHVVYPPIGLDDFTGTVDGDTVVTDVNGGEDYLAVGQYIILVTVNSAADGENYYITAVSHDDPAPARATLTLDRDTGYTAATLNLAHIRDKVYNLYYHKKSAKFILHIGTRLYISADAAMSAWYLTNYYVSPGTTSQITELGDMVYVFTTTVIIAIDMTDTTALSTNPPQSFKLNATCPTTLITNQNTNEDGSARDTKNYPYGYKYVYCLSRLSGTAVDRNRQTSGIRVISQSGPVTVNSAYRDFGTVYTGKPIGDETTIYGILTGGALPGGSYELPSYWAAISLGCFTISIDGLSKNIECCFTGATTMDEVAEEIDLALKEYYPYASCVFSVVTNRHFVITNSKEYAAVGTPAASIITVTTAGTGGVGTDIGSIFMSCQAGNGTVTTPAVTDNVVIGTLTLPSVSDANHWTHYSIYRTLDIGNNGIDGVTGNVNNSELFVWIDDIPICKAFKASVVDNGNNGTITITGTTANGKFTTQDIGSYIKRIGVATTYYIGAVNAVTGLTATIYDTSAMADYNGGNIAEIGWCLGTTIAFQGSQTATRFVCANPAGGIFTDPSDTAIIFYSDGSYINVIYATDITDGYGYPSQTIAANTAGCTMIKNSTSFSSRYFNDTISDKILRTRINGYSLQNRFWQPLPACNTGVISGQFIFGGIRDAEYMYYSQIIPNYEYLMGYYNSDKQKIKLTDTIQLITAFKDWVVSYNSRSISKIPNNVYNLVVLENIGEVTAIISSIQYIDQNIGIKDYGSFTEIDQDRHIIITSEPAIRVISPGGMSENIIEDRMMDKLYLLQLGSSASYDPINGYIFWATDSATNQTRKIADGCYQIAIDKNQGIGYSICSGADWIYPELYFKGIKFFDSSGNPHYIMYDYKSGAFYDIATVDGSGDRTMVWKDKVLADGTGGTAIAPSVTLREDRGTFEHYFLDHKESHVYLRPYKESNRDAAGHDSNGYSTGMAVDLNIYANGNPTATATADDIPLNGDIVFDRKVEGNRLQIKITANNADHYLMGTQQYYVAKDRAAAPANKVMTEMTNQTEFATPTLWPDIINSTLKNRATGNDISITYTAAADLLSNTRGLQIAAAVNFGSVTLTAGCLLIWTNGTIAVTIGGVAVALSNHGTSGAWTLKYANAITQTGALVITPTGTPTIFDLRVFNSAISATARTYYYADMTGNSGKEIYPC